MTRKQQVALDAHAAELQRIADRMRETADGLQRWWACKSDHGPCACERGTHPIHAANRLRKLAGELAKERTGK